MSSTGVRAFALSSYDVPHGHELVVRSCEDCACPTSGARAARPERTVHSGRPLVRSREVFELELDAGHWVLFAPQGNGGVVVVNEAGLDIFRRFHSPVAPAELSGHEPEAVTQVVRRLVEQDLVHEPGTPAVASFAESRELTAWLHVTNACNLRCTYCYVHKSADEMDTALAKSSVDALVDSALRHGFRSLRLKYAGGEASLNAAVLLELHDHAVARCAEHGLDLSAVVLSNGVALPARFTRDLLQRSIRVMISLDSLGAAHDAQRPTLGGKPSAHLVMRTIDQLVERGLPPHLSITITSGNTADIASVVRFALARDLTFSFNFFRDNACTSDASGLQYEQQAMVDGVTDAFAAIEEAMPPWSVLGSVLDRGQLTEPRRKSCGVGDDYVVIDQRGQISQCHMELGSPVGRIGADDPITAVRRPGIRNLLAEEKEGCRDCTWRNWCTGGCSVATFRATGRFDVRSPNCGIYKAIYPAALRLEGLRVLRFADSDA
ncbi:SPASM domain-containing protein [Lentzea sp. BCCO 10_0856]|uniref:SPASM domain-containing protein n=1 Tax=Lentzea miocenica TaxID=3095431 RepID=A0ABU4TB66_9PSEU|nr:SPASM domain-containing protein [Lentzea sp. BCCO 10_0856]MDX8035289.1 SPASM domain-containing protein [Lentzea sp. BCCO 10_0856]